MKEDDICPEALLKKYLELSKQDAQLLFSSETRQIIPCEACESDKYIFEFENNLFEYASCKNCGTLFHSPWPFAKAFELC